MDYATATREVYWNISYGKLIYLFLLISVIIAAYGFYQRIALWKRGMPAERFDRPAARIKRLLLHAAAQQRTVRDK